MADALTAAQSALVEEHAAFASTAARAARRRWPTADPELLSAWAVDGLIDAARRFDPSASAKFTTYAWLRIRGEIVDQYRSHAGSRRQARIVEVSLEHDDGTVDERVLAVDELGFDRVVDAVHAAATVGSLGLSERERYVLVELGSGTTMSEIGAALGVSESRVSQIRRQIYERLPVRPSPRCARCAGVFVRAAGSSQAYCGMPCKRADERERYGLVAV